jgi:hypothetical protein
MVSSKSRRVSRDGLTGNATPPATATHLPIPHREVVDLVLNAAGVHGLEINKEEYGVSNDGCKLFGIVRFKPAGDSDLPYSRAIGLRNSHDKSMAVGLSAGASVLVCDNMCFGGEAVICRRHTKGMDIPALVDAAMEELLEQYARMDRRIDTMRYDTITSYRAKVKLVDLATKGAINSSDIVPVMREFDNPTNEEFNNNSEWSFFNAITRVAKKYGPARADKCYRYLADDFQLK